MKVPNDHMATEQAIDRLKKVLDRPIRHEASGGQPDPLVHVGPHLFALQWKRSGSLAQVALAANSLVRATRDSDPPQIPLLAVPFMGARGRSHCEQLGVSWLDLSGNSSITAEGLYVRERGCRNKFRRRAPVESPFGPKGSRIARWLLIHPGRVFRQRELARAVGLDEGYTSRVVRRLLDHRLVERDRGGVRVLDHDMLLDSWEEHHRFDRHALIRGHIAAQAGPQLARSLAEALDGRGIDYAMTGLAAAWFQAAHATFRILTVYLKELPSAELMSALSFREEPRGANTWIVMPNDDGVFQASATLDGVRCVHPVQTYLDLRGHPERAREAADELRRRLLTWDRHDGGAFGGQD